MDRNEREKIGKRAAYLAIAGNIFLSVFNFLVGMISGSYALISEGAHTISDIMTSIIAYLGFKFGSKPADHDHPLGHGRAEAIAGLVIVVFLALIAYEIITGAIDKLFFNGVTTIPSPIAVVMAVIGIFVNIIMSQSIIKLGEKANSPAIVADGKHQRVDIYSSVAILFGVLISQYGYPMLDPIIGLFIGFMIAKTAFEVARENLNNIMGKVPDESLFDEVKEVAESVDGVMDAHDIRINYFGSYATVTLHVVLPEDLSLKEAHAISHKVQDKILKNIDFIHGVTAHACPQGVEYCHFQQLDE